MHIMKQCTAKTFAVTPLFYIASQLVYYFHSGIPFTFGYAIFIQVYLLHLGIRFTFGYTIFIQVYLLHLGMLFVFRYTFYIWVYDLHLGIPFSFRYTFYIWVCYFFYSEQNNRQQKSIINILSIPGTCPYQELTLYFVSSGYVLADEALNEDEQDCEKCKSCLSLRVDHYKSTVAYLLKAYGFDASIPQTNTGNAQVSLLHHFYK